MQSKAVDVKDKSYAPTPHRRRIGRLDRLGDVRHELARVYREARTGAIAWQDATRAAFILGQLARLLEQSEIAERLDMLEDQMAAGPQGRPALRRVA